MASLLRQIVASPRVRHPEANIDLCYATENIIVTSGPSSSYLKSRYRTPIKTLVSFLDDKHKDNWSIWEFRAEGTNYEDSSVYNRIRHYPWPDHHPPPFALIPLIMGSMRNWLKDDGIEDRVAVIHCKAGKGRSGTVTCSYLISEEGWTPEDATKRFTERRMRPGFGVGISIPSQRRTISYVDRWTRHGKKYIERAAEVLEVHIWGLRDGVKIAIEGFIDEGKVIKTLHTFKKSEQHVSHGVVKESSITDAAKEILGPKKESPWQASADGSSYKPSLNDSLSGDIDKESAATDKPDTYPAHGDVIFKPAVPIHVPSSDICIDIERTSKTKLGGISMVTAIAHVWFNIFFEGNGPEQDGHADENGVFEIDWDALDGLKGSARKGTKAFDRMAVVWRASRDEKLGGGVEIRQPGPHEEVRQTQPADWRQVNGESDEDRKRLGLRSTSKNIESADDLTISTAAEQEKHEPLGRQLTAEVHGNAVP